MEESIKVEMLSDITASPNGIKVVEYNEGEYYDLPKDLAKTFVKKLKVAEYVDDDFLKERKNRLTLSELDLLFKKGKQLKGIIDRENQIRQDFVLICNAIQNLEKENVVQSEDTQGLIAKTQRMEKNYGRVKNEYEAKKDDKTRRQLYDAVESIFKSFDKAIVSSKKGNHVIKEKMKSYERLDESILEMKNNHNKVVEILDEIASIIAE